MPEVGAKAARDGPGFGNQDRSSRDPGPAAQTQVATWATREFSLDLLNPVSGPYRARLYHLRVDPTQVELAAVVRVD